VAPGIRHGREAEWDPQPDRRRGDVHEPCLEAVGSLERAACRDHVLKVVVVRDGAENDLGRAALLARGSAVGRGRCLRYCVVFLIAGSLAV
jgi:hypothetical protein